MSILKQIYQTAFNNELEKIGSQTPKLKTLIKAYKFLESKMFGEKKQRKRKHKQYLFTELFGK